MSGVKYQSFNYYILSILYAKCLGPEVLFLIVLEFELRASQLLGRHLNCSTPQVLDFGALLILDLGIWGLGLFNL
jgi:hypothetical protein